MTLARLTSLLFGNFPGAAGLALRGLLYPGLFGRCGRGALFGARLEIIGGEGIRLGEGAVVSDGCRLICRDGGSIEIGDGVFLGRGTSLVAAGGRLCIDEGASLGSYCSVRAAGPLRIGRKALLAAYVRVGAEAEKGASRKGTVVGEGAWLGVRARVPAGAAVGRDAVVGAHALVEGEIPVRTVAAGIPARVLRPRREGEGGEGKLDL